MYPSLASMTRMEWQEHETRCWFDAHAERGLKLSSMDRLEREAVIQLMTLNATAMRDMERAKRS